MNFNKNLLYAIDRIEKARIATDRKRIVQIVAASKYFGEDDIAELYKCGQRSFGENKVQDLANKMEYLEKLPLEWHFIGTLQRNKINALISLNPYLLHSLHSMAIAKAIQERLERDGKQLNALLQVNSAREVNKSGFAPEEALEAYAEISETCKNINLQGLMSIGAHCDDKKIIQNSFEITHKLFEQIPNASILSMGMSGDFELAIQCGSNLVRLGSILFR